MLPAKAKKDILNLCDQVEEILHNNDWPTEEGRRDDKGNSRIGDLVNRIKQALNTDNP